MISEQQKQTVLQFLKPLSPYKVGVFGSYARGEQHEQSDLDLLLFVDAKARFSLLELIGVEQRLSDALGIRVDLVLDRSLHPLVRPYVEQDLTFI
ncbi:MAG: nucleotidyltransferase family protein [Cyclobacteriaceae bacterium]